MNRRLKAIGLTLAALLAMAALPAFAASAEFHSETSETVISGSQAEEDIWTFNAGTLTCKEATYSGTQSTVTSESVSLTPKYSECKAFGFINTTVDVNKCELTTKPNNNPAIHLDCAPFVSMVVTAFNCWVTIPDQEFNSGITYTNTGAGSTRHVSLDINLGNLTYTQHPKSFPGCSNGVFGNGKNSGKATVKGAKEGKQVGIWVE